MNKTLILIPTYNEIKNIKSIYSEIKALNIKTDILFIDDNSPDKTANLIKNLSRNDKSIFLITRKEKLGIGSAHLQGINWAYKKGYNTLITMDCDFTHKPKDILRLLKYKDSADIILGSRYLSDKSLSAWNFFRKILSQTEHFLTKKMLSLKYDATGAFRLYNLDKIAKEVFNISESKGYSFFFESLFILNLNNHSIKEISISLPARTYGHSKMKISDVLNSTIFLFQTYYLSKIYKDSYTYSPPFLKEKKIYEKGEDEWNSYWISERRKRKILYDSIAVFYRKYIIKRTLNYHVKKSFRKGSKVLHAGCGGGQVDTAVVKMVNVTALDISVIALNRYKRLYGDLCKVIHGSILNIPAKNESFDGIYNLGVMEHFTKKDIGIILDEFHRILKKNGKILLFWPPQFGLSVIFLNTVHFILNDILGKNIRLHPEEITKVKSKRQIEKILLRSNFKLIDFNFGPSDLFTCCIILAEKA